MRQWQAVATAVVVTAAVVACQSDGTPVGAPSPTRSASPSPLSVSSTATHFAGLPTVGPLFVARTYPALHTCTASVVHSSSRDVILTAAHCLTGSAEGYRFVPGYRNGEAPYGVWTVTGAYGGPAWIDRRNPHRDWAFLTVAPARVNGQNQRLQDVTGASRLGGTASAGSHVTVVGYALGRDDEPLRCTTRVYRHRAYPAFDCDGFPAGTSGSPWLVETADGPVVGGVIGGLHQGGCTPATSYSPLLGVAARRALSRAEHHAAADTFPVRGPDGCS
jgi:hypothetical protein